MSGLPKLTIFGTLTGDPEIKMLPSGAAITTVNIAANERKFNKETRQYENGSATFIRGTLWRQYAENVAESLNKGDRVFAYGELKQRSYDAKDGTSRTVMELEIEEIGPTLRFATVSVSRGAAATPVSAGWGAASDEPTW